MQRACSKYRYKTYSELHSAITFQAIHCMLLVAKRSMNFKTAFYDVSSKTEKSENRVFLRSRIFFCIDDIYHFSTSFEAFTVPRAVRLVGGRHKRLFRHEAADNSGNV